MCQRSLRVTIAALLASLAAVLLHAKTAAASGSPYACVAFTNNTNHAVMLSQATLTTGSWISSEAAGCGNASFYGNAGPSGWVAPGVTVYWASASPDSPSTDGTGGQVTTGDSGSGVTWGVPWSYFHGFGGSCSGHAFGNATIGDTTAGSNQCAFNFGYSVPDTPIVFSSQTPVKPNSGYDPNQSFEISSGVYAADWMNGSFKGQCYQEQAVTGLSMDAKTGALHGLLCDDTSTIGVNSSAFPQPSSCHPLSFGLGQGNNPNPWPFGSWYVDWDQGFLKAQCAQGEYMAGVSQTTSGYPDGILCCPVDDVGASSCNAEVFFAQNSTDYRAPDWDSGFFKGECAAGKYAVGLSAVATGLFQGLAHALYCCEQ